MGAIATDSKMEEVMWFNLLLKALISLMIYPSDGVGS